MPKHGWQVSSSCKVKVGGKGGGIYETSCIFNAYKADVYFFAGMPSQKTALVGQKRQRKWPATQ